MAKVPPFSRRWSAQLCSYSLNATSIHRHFIRHHAHVYCKGSFSFGDGMSGKLFVQHCCSIAILTCSLDLIIDKSITNATIRPKYFQRQFTQLLSSALSSSRSSSLPLTLANFICYSFACTGVIKPYAC